MKKQERLALEVYHRGVSEGIEALRKSLWDYADTVPPQYRDEFVPGIIASIKFVEHIQEGLPHGQ